MRFGSVLTLAATALLCAASCIPPRLTATDGGAAGTTGAAGGTPTAVTVAIASDEDDALWIRGTDERLHYSEDNLAIEVGNDAEQARAGLRFQVAVPAGARITSATLSVRWHSSKLERAGAIVIHVYDSADVAPFDDAHTHRPEDHDARGLAGKTIDGFIVQENDGIYTTPDIRELVQRIIDRAEWNGAGAIGFVLSPQQGAFVAGDWVAFNDSSLKSDPPSLTIRYVAP